MDVYLVPLGEIEDDLIQSLKRRLSSILSLCNFFTGERIVNIPDNAFNKVRKQYNSSKLLSILSPKLHYESFLLITDQDIYLNYMKYAFGEAQIGGRSAITSTFRLVKSSDRHLSFERIVKEAVHEIGHIFGLLHCDNPTCVMFFSKNVSISDTKGVNFCNTCSGKLG